MAPVGPNSEQILNSAQTRAAQIISIAEARAAELNAIAERSARTIVQRAEARLAEVGNQISPPAIGLLGYPVKLVNRSEWYVGFELTIRLVDLYFNSRKARVEAAKPFTRMFWLKVARNGSFCPTSLATFAGWHMPHVDYSSACMEVQDVPKLLTTHAEYGRVKASLERALSGMQLASLYSGYKSWPVELKRFIPAEIRKELRAGRYGESTFDIPGLWTVEKEGETWKTGTDD